VLHKEIPFIRIGLPLCVGIISGLYLKPDPLFLSVAAVIIFSGFIASLFFNSYRSNIFFGFPVTLTFFIVGFLIYRNEKDSLSVLAPEQTIFAGTLSDYPEEKENSFMLKVKLNSKISSFGSVPVHGSFLLYNKKDSSGASFLPGDILIFKCTPAQITNRGNPYEFDYRFYMENNGIKYYAFNASSDILRHFAPAHRKIIYKALIIREKIIEMYKKSGVSDERLPLVAAITLGQKSKLDPEQKQNFIRAGVMHIMAVSGLHAVILSLFVFNLLFFMKGKFNILRIFITIGVLWSFAFVTGLTPSVLRATLMFTFLHAGNILKRKVNGINSVLASAFVLVLIRPSVIFDAGFLLSYAAVIYIICFYRDLFLKLQFKSRLPDMIWQSAVVTIVAQAGTLPLTIMLFNRFPTYFILTNIIIVPLSSLLVIIGCIIPLSFPVHFLSKILGLVLDRLTGLTDLLSAKAASLPFSNIENIGLTTVGCIFLTGSIFLFSYFLLRKKSFSSIYLFIIILLYVTSGTIKDISVRTTNELIVYNTPGSSIVGIRAGKTLNVYSDTSLMKAEVLRHSATLGLKIKMIGLKNKVFCIRAGEKRILICKSLYQNVLDNFKPDIIILTGAKPVIAPKLTFRQSPEAIILSPESSLSFRLPFNYNNTGIDYIYFVRKSGAFISSI
jgi:competence protein ComEC